MASNGGTTMSAYYYQLDGDAKKRYDEKIKKCNGIDPYTFKSKDLSLASKDFPAITVWDIGNYMIHSVSPYTKRFFNNYKGTDAYAYFDSGFVLSVGTKKLNDLAIVTGKVKHSQRMNEAALNVWIIATMEGEIFCGHCNCLAGLTETCSHVGAICFAVKNFAEATETKSVTEILCKWNVPRYKDVSMDFAKNIKWKAHTHDKTRLESSFLEHCDSFGHLSDERINAFIAKCHSDGDVTALGTIIHPLEHSRKTNLRDEVFLASVYRENNRNKSLPELIEIGKSNPLKVSNDEAKQISQLTLPRLKSKCSVGLQRGRIAGSSFKSCCMMNNNEPSLITIRRVINPTKKSDEIPGVKDKKKAIELYTRSSASIHEEFVFIETGLIINPKMPHFVGSPDGLISCICHGHGCLELQYLKVMESDEPYESLTRKPNNILNKDGNDYCLERSHEFFYRVQLEMHVAGLEYCDFLIWSRQKSLLLTIDADITFWEEAMKKATTFHEHVIMPELLGKFYTQMKNFPEFKVKCDEKPELIALEIEILGIEEMQDIPGSIISSTTSKAIEPEGELYDFQQSLSISLTELNLKQPKQKEHERNSVESKKSFKPIIKDLKSLSLSEICSTFDDNEQYLTDIYSRLIKQTKSHYYPTDLPPFAAFDLITEKQFEAMVQVAEAKLVKNAEEHNSSDVIFDAIIAEWAYKVFAEKYNLNRKQAVAAVNQMKFSEAEVHNL